MLQKDPGLAGPQNANFGDYLGSFMSEKGQVRADFFRRNKYVYAYISFSPGFDLETTTDRWRGVLVEEAKALGFEQDKLSVVYH